MNWLCAGCGLAVPQLASYRVSRMFVDSFCLQIIEPWKLLGPNGGAGYLASGTLTPSFILWLTNG